MRFKHALCRYYVNRDTLFSYHASAEAFLQRLMGIYVSAHYKVRSIESISTDSSPFAELAKRSANAR